MRSFVHFMFLSLVLSGVGILNETIPLSLLEVLHLGKTVFSKHYNTFFRDNKNTSQTPLKITNETLLRCLFTICYAGSEVWALVKSHQKS